MTLHQLKVFATVAKLKSFTQAARSLDVRQSSISLLVKSLEMEYRVKLFEKLGNKIHLTPAGKQLLTRTGEILAKVDRIREELNEIKGLKKATLSVGGSSVAGASFLPRAVEKFKKEYPEVQVQVRIGRGDLLEKNLLDGEIDIAVTSGRPESSLLVSEPYGKEEVVAFAPPRHPLAKRRSVSLSLIAKEPLIVHEKGAPTREMIEERFAQKGLQLRPAVEMNFFGGRDIMRNMVAGGQGISFLSRCFVSGDHEAGRVKILNVPELKVHRTLHIAVHKRRHGLPLIQAFLASLRQLKRS